MNSSFNSLYYIFLDFQDFVLNLLCCAKVYISVGTYSSLVDIFIKTPKLFQLWCCQRVKQWAKQRVVGFSWMVSLSTVCVLLVERPYVQQRSGTDHALPDYLLFCPGFGLITCLCKASANIKAVCCQMNLILTNY